MQHGFILSILLWITLRLSAQEPHMINSVTAGITHTTHTGFRPSYNYSEVLADCRTRIHGLSATDSLAHHLDSIRVHYDRALSAACADEQLASVACDQALLQKGLSFRQTWARRHNRILNTNIGWRDIATRLAPDEAAIEFVRFLDYGQENTERKERYAAFILLPDGAPPRFVSLCNEEELKTTLMQTTAPEFKYQLLYATIQGVHSPLYPLIWRPIEPYLSGVQTIYYAPDGLLYKLNLEAIQPVKRECLADRYFMRQMSSLHLLMSERTIPNGRTSAVVFASPIFDLDTNNTPAQGAWRYLPGAQKEGAEVLRLLSRNNFKVLFREGSDATEIALKKAFNGKKPSSRILHLATHGFCLHNTPKTGDSKETAGLLMAGANKNWKTNHAFDNHTDDGILTAAELSQMDLRHTELVVLSAGESGLLLADVKDNLYGLPNACKLAGARYVIGTLWTMPDNVFVAMMQSFYEQWLEKGLHIPDAFQAAQLQLRNRYSNPFYWAGFVLIE